MRNTLPNVAILLYWFSLPFFGDAQLVTPSLPRLHLAAKRGDLEELNMLILRPGYDLDNVDHVGRTALLIAIREGQISAVEMLCNAGVDIEISDEDGWNAIRLAAREGHRDIVNLLLDRGMSPNSRSEDGRTPLMGAAFQGFMDTVEVLLKAGANINDKDKRKWTALIYATRQGKDATIVQLVKAGANLEARDHNGCTPLMIAVKLCMHTTIGTLIEFGANLDTNDKDGETPLSWSVKNKKIDIFTLCLQGGASLEKERKDGTTIEDLAKLTGQNEVLEIIKDNKKKAAMAVEKNDALDALTIALCYRESAKIKAAIESVNQVDYSMEPKTQKRIDMLVSHGRRVLDIIQKEEEVEEKLDTAIHAYDISALDAAIDFAENSEMYTLGLYNAKVLRDKLSKQDAEVGYPPITWFAFAVLVAVPVCCLQKRNPKKDMPPPSATQRAGLPKQRSRV